MSKLKLHIRNIVILTFIMSFTGCVYPYPEEAHEIADQIVRNLVAAGYCEERKECNYVKVSGKPGYAIVNIYDAKNLKDKEILMVFNVSQSIYKEYEKALYIRVSVYEQIHEKVRKLFSGLEPHIEFTFESRNN